MSKASVYTELAIANKWFVLARLWFENNTPCSKEKMFVELGLLMPSTVRRGSSPLMTKSRMVVEAYRRLYKTNGEIPDTIPKYESQGKKGVSPTSRDLLRAMLKEGDIVGFEKVRHIKWYAESLRQLVLRKECYRVGDTWTLKRPDGE